MTMTDCGLSSLVSRYSANNVSQHRLDIPTQACVVYNTGMTMVCSAEIGYLRMRRSLNSPTLSPCGPSSHAASGDFLAIPPMCLIYSILSANLSSFHHLHSVVFPHLLSI